MGGNVRYLIAPDMEHHIFLTEWARAYPDARLLGPEGLPEKRAGMAEHRDAASFQHVWTAKDKASFRVDQDFDRDFEYEFVDSHANKELVFCYRPERVLIEADLLFNLPATEQYSRARESATDGFFTKLFTRLNTTKGDALWQRRLVWYLASRSDRKEFAKSVEKIYGWDWDMIIPCHGDVIESGGKEIFRKVMAWHLQVQTGQ
jgi:hypothetical protein